MSWLMHTQSVMKSRNGIDIELDDYEKMSKSWTFFLLTAIKSIEQMILIHLWCNRSCTTWYYNSEKHCPILSLSCLLSISDVKLHVFRKHCQMLSLIFVHCFLFLFAFQSTVITGKCQLISDTLTMWKWRTYKCRNLTLNRSSYGCVRVCICLENR